MCDLLLCIICEDIFAEEHPEYIKYKCNKCHICICTYECVSDTAQYIINSSKKECSRCNRYLHSIK